jgi:hypothetical protein
VDAAHGAPSSATDPVAPNRLVPAVRAGCP